MAFTVIHDETLSSSASTMTKSSIPQTYTHLKVCWSVRSTRASRLDNMRIQVNGSTTTSHYKGTHLFTATGTPAAFRYTSHPGINLESMPAAQTTNVAHFGSGEFWIMDYTSTTRYKQIMVDYGSNADSSTDWYWTGGMVAGIYTQNTNAITQITLDLTNGSFQANSQWTIYGMTGAS